METSRDPSQNLTHAIFRYADSPLTIGDFDGAHLSGQGPIIVNRYWSGLKVENGREFSAYVEWSDTALHVNFEALRNEPLIVSQKPDVSKKTIGLWNRDVFEIFIAPDASPPNKYFEFEVAPTGEWVDVSMEIVDGKRCPDMGYSSGMETYARIQEDRVVMAMKIPWAAFGVRPEAGDVWRGNIFRCVGSGDTRGYLAWIPTFTETPNFHVPEAFGEFVFVD